jgi:hypothetical protein
LFIIFLIATYSIFLKINKKVIIKMNLSVATKSLLLSSMVVGALPAARAQNCSIALPDISDVMELAFPTWNVDENNARIDGGGKWNPYYLVS